MSPRSPAEDFFTALLETRTGQRVSAARTWRIEAALRPLMRERGLASLDALADAVRRDKQTLAVRVTEALLNNETSFFRDMAVFEHLQREALPEIAAQRPAKRLRLWSAGCSSGQEAYSLAMLFQAEAARWEGWSIEILATDISSATVARARKGAYSQFEIQRGLPVRTMLRWFVQSGEEWAVDPALKKLIRFGTHNLLDIAPGRFDLILCRNVLMYLKPDLRRRVFDRLATALEADGALILGAGETVIGQTTAFQAHPRWRGVYAPVKGPAVRRAA